MWRALIFLLCLAAGSRQLSISEFLVPDALNVGEDAHLQCKYELLKNESEKALFVKWWWTPLNSSNDERYQLYQRIAGHPAEIVHNHHKNIELDENDGIKLLNVTPTISGNYECEVSNIDEVRQHKKLIVFSIGSGPMLNASVMEDEQTNVLVSCEAFDVAPRPDVVITLNGEKLETSRDLTELEDGLYKIYENATLQLDKADDGEFQCEIFFEDKDIPHAPYVVSLTFEAPTASTPEPEEYATEPLAAATAPPDNGSFQCGDSWILLTLLNLLIVLLI